MRDAQEIVELLIENECVFNRFSIYWKCKLVVVLTLLMVLAKVPTGNLQKLALQCICRSVVVDIEVVCLTATKLISTSI